MLTDVCIVGGRLAGGLAAAYLKKHLPALRVTIVAPANARLPLVGESTVEATVMFLHEIGLSEYLEREHLPKYGLTFYYKVDDAGADPSYFVLENRRGLPVHAKHLNRERFDRYLREHVERLGVEFLEGKVNDVQLSRNGPHRLACTVNGRQQAISARFIIDASGRSQFLARRLGLARKPSRRQRSSFWLRLARFDRSLWLDKMRLVKPAQSNFDPFMCSHHFMGRAHWIWGIPLKSEDGDDLISLGITWRPDLYSRQIRNVDDLKVALEADHPMLARFLASGVVEDVATYQNYLYGTSQVYSSDRWYLLGDAAYAADPLFSSGLLFTTLQIRQIATMIAEDLAGTLTPCFVEGLDVVARSAFETLQTSITSHYEVMDDPFQSHVLTQWDSNQYMHFYLPLFSRGYYWNRTAVAWLRRQREFVQRQAQIDRRRHLLMQAADSLKGRHLRDMIDGYGRVLNYEFTGSGTPAAPMIAKGLRNRAWLRWQVLKRARLQGLTRAAPDLIADLGAAGVVALLGDRLLPEYEPPTASTTPMDEASGVHA